MKKENTLAYIINACVVIIGLCLFIVFFRLLSN